MKKFFDVYGYSLSIAMNVILVVSLIAFVLMVNEKNAQEEIQVSEDDFSVICLVSQSVGEDITNDVMSVASSTGESIQRVVFSLYPEEYLSANKLMETVDGSMNLS